MVQMGQAIRQFFMTLFVFFSATEKLAKAGEHLSTWAEESAGAFADEARVKRMAQLKAMQKQHGLTVAEAKALSAPKEEKAAA